PVARTGCCRTSPCISHAALLWAIRRSRCFGEVPGPRPGGRPRPGHREPPRGRRRAAGPGQAPPGPTAPAPDRPPVPRLRYAPPVRAGPGSPVCVASANEPAPRPGGRRHFVAPTWPIARPYGVLATNSACPFGELEE